MNLNADVIIPCTVATPFLKYVAEVSVRTCVETTSARVWVFCNNSPDTALRRDFEDNCLAIGAHYSYWNDSWNMNRFFNRGIKCTVGEYIALCNQDMIFYQDWFENIVKQWTLHPEYFVLMPFTFGRVGTAFMRNPPDKADGIRQCHDVTSGVTVHKRSNGYLYDEQFPDFEQDTDLQLFCEHKTPQLKRGVVLSSRVDHIFCTVRNNTDMGKMCGIANVNSVSKEALKVKWGLK